MKGGEEFEIMNWWGIEESSNYSAAPTPFLHTKNFWEVNNGLDTFNGNNEFDYDFSRPMMQEGPFNNADSTDVNGIAFISDTSFTADPDGFASEKESPREGTMNSEEHLQETFPTPIWISDLSISNPSDLPKGGKAIVTSPAAVPRTNRLICGINECTRSYGRRFELHRHQKAHSGIKSYSCTFDTCDRAGRNGFTRKDHLKQHLRQVHRIFN